MTQHDLKPLLAQLREHLTHHPHVLASELPDRVSEPDAHLTAWTEHDSPYTWAPVESAAPHYLLLADYGYGLMALFDNGVYVAHSKRTITTPSLVVLDRDYYGVDYYMWRPA